MAVDALMRKLKVPSKFVPYLEKHRIYELFYDIGNELAMSQPEDPLLCIKECLQRFSRVRDKRLVVILAPCDIDRIKLGQLISAKTGYGMLSRYIMCGKSGNHLDPVTLAVNTAEHIRSSDKEGWIFVDYPQSKEEAKMLIKHKVIPTHTFLLVPTDQATHNQENEYIQSIKTSPSILKESDNIMFELREIFKSSLKLVSFGDTRLEDIASLCAQMTRQMIPRHAPKHFRVALIGPKGSRRKTIAKLLQEKFKLVHVDIFHLINAARQLDNDVGDEIKRLDKFGHPYSNKLIFNLLKSRLYKNDCLERGYVLTNYPHSYEDFVLLDSIETPPNKVIFIDIEGAVCKSSLDDRVVNMYTGKLYSKNTIQDDDLLKNQTLIHPDDEPCVIEEELKFYNNHIIDMMNYCGKTGFVIDGLGPIKTFFERVESILMSPAPNAVARSGRLDKTRSSIIKHGSATENAVNLYPLPYTQEVVPLIDSEELIRRFEELKNHFSNPSVSENMERYSSLSRDTNGGFNSQKNIQNEGFGDVLSEGIGMGNENTYQSIQPELGGEDNNSTFAKFLVFDTDKYCTCDEPLLVDENSICTCDSPLLLNGDYCTCDEPLFIL